MNTPNRVHSLPDARGERPAAGGPYAPSTVLSEFNAAVAEAAEEHFFEQYSRIAKKTKHAKMTRRLSRTGYRRVRARSS